MKYETITFKGFTALVTAHVSLSALYGSVIYLEIAGAEAEIKAIWSRLVSAKAKKTGVVDGVAIGDRDVQVSQNVKYFTLRKVLPNGQHLYGLLHPKATVLEMRSRSFYLVIPAFCDLPPPGFFPRLAQSLAVPVKAEWAGWLWERGQKFGKFSYSYLIRKLYSTGHMAGYAVNTHNTDGWLELIQSGLGFKVCAHCKEPVRELIEVEHYVGYGLSQRTETQEICFTCYDEKRGKK